METITYDFLIVLSSCALLLIFLIFTSALFRLFSYHLLRYATGALQRLRLDIWVKHWKRVAALFDNLINVLPCTAEEPIISKWHPLVFHFAHAKVFARCFSVRLHFIIYIIRLLVDE